MHLPIPMRMSARPCAPKNHDLHPGYGSARSRFPPTRRQRPFHAELVRKYADRSMDFADACLVYMSEQTRDCRIVTIDRTDFSVYRWHGRVAIPLLLPD